MRPDPDRPCCRGSCRRRAPLAAGLRHPLSPSRNALHCGRRPRESHSARPLGGRARRHPRLGGNPRCNSLARHVSRRLSAMYNSLEPHLSPLKARRPREQLPGASVSLASLYYANPARGLAGPSAGRGAAATLPHRGREALGRRDGEGRKLLGHLPAPARGAGHPHLRTPDQHLEGRPAPATLVLEDRHPRPPEEISLPPPAVRHPSAAGGGRTRGSWAPSVTPNELQIVLMRRQRCRAK